MQRIYQDKLDNQQQEDGIHAAIIMDGNGRWATRTGLPRSAGHRAGVKTLRKIVEAAPRLGIHTLTVYAFSTDNWRRPAAEVSTLMTLLQHYLEHELQRLIKNGVRLSFIGRRDRLPAAVTNAIEQAEQASRHEKGLHLRIALDYSSRDAIVHAAANCRPTGLTRENLSRCLHMDEDIQDVDLLIRTGGEKRLSDFLLWECAYAELYFSDTYWPDFAPSELAQAVRDFNQRERRFGGLTISESAETDSPKLLVENCKIEA